MYAEEAAEHFMELGARVDEISFAPAFAESCVAKLEEGFTDNFARQASASGEAWPPRKNPKGKHPLLILTGALVRSVGTQAPGHVERVGDRVLELGTNLVYAATHEFGSPSRNIPARPYLSVTDDILDACEAAIAERFEQYVFGGGE